MLAIMQYTLDRSVISKIACDEKDEMGTGFYH